MCHTWFDGRGSLIGFTLFVATMMVTYALVGTGSLIGSVKLAIEGIRTKSWMTLSLSPACFLLGVTCLAMVVMFWDSTMCYFGAW